MVSCLSARNFKGMMSFSRSSLVSSHTRIFSAIVVVILVGVQSGYCQAYTFSTTAPVNSTLSIPRFPNSTLISNSISNSLLKDTWVVSRHGNNTSQSPSQAPAVATARSPARNSTSSKIDSHTESVGGPGPYVSPEHSVSFNLSEGGQTSVSLAAPSNTEYRSFSKYAAPTYRVSQTPTPSSLPKTGLASHFAGSSITNLFNTRPVDQTSVVFSGSAIYYTKATFIDLATITGPTTVTTSIVETRQDGSHSTKSDAIIVVGPRGQW